MKFFLFVVWLGYSQAFLAPLNIRTSIKPIPICAVHKTFRGYSCLARLPLTKIFASLRIDDQSFSVGDAVEAKWIGDDGWYPATIEGYLAGRNYDIKWADPQGLSDAQVTPVENVRPFNPAVYYRFGLNALKQDDKQSAYLAFRCLLVLKGGYGDSETLYKTLLQNPEIQAFAQSRGDEDVLTKPRKVQAESVGEVDSGLFSEEELADLREEAAEDQVKRDMWRQHNLFVAQHVGIWHGLWTRVDISQGRPTIGGKRTERRVTELGLGESQAGETVPPMVCRYTDALGRPQGGHVTRFYPAEETAWFVGNGATTATGWPDSLTLQLALRHSDARAAAEFTYRWAEGRWELAEVGLGRERLGAFPAPSDALFSGPAGRRSADDPDDAGDVTVAVEGRLVAWAPAALAEGSGDGRPQEVVLQWCTPAVQGVGWDGKARLVPALRYRCARVLRGAGPGLEMLSLMEAAPDPE